MTERGGAARTGRMPPEIFSAAPHLRTRDALKLVDKKRKDPRAFSVHWKPLPPLQIRHISLDTSNDSG